MSHNPRKLEVPTKPPISLFEGTLVEAREHNNASSPKPPSYKTCLVVPRYNVEPLQRKLVTRDLEDKPVYSGKGLREASEDFLVIAPGEGLYGRRFKNIFISRAVYEQAEAEGTWHRLTPWIEEGLRCRLLPGGQIIDLP